MDSYNEGGIEVCVIQGALCCLPMPLALALSLVVRTGYLHCPGKKY